MSKTTNPAQYAKLVNLMATKADIAGGYHKRPKEEVQEFWEEVSETLNALGPPAKNALSWKKVWVDWKSYVKRKLTNNKKERAATGGGPCRLQSISALEEKLIMLTGLVTNTNGIAGAVDFGVVGEVQQRGVAGEVQQRGVAGEVHDREVAGEVHDREVAGEVHYREVAGRVHLSETIEMDISARSEDFAEQRSSSKKRQQQSPRATTSSLLKEQVELQREFYKNSKQCHEAALEKLEGITTHLRRISRSEEKSADIAAKQLEEVRRHNKIKEQLLKEKVEIKLRMLKLEHPSLSDSL